MTGTGLDEQRYGFLGGKPAALFDERFQVRARDVFHDDEKLSLIQPEVMDGDNIWVRQVGGSFGFLAEAIQEGRVTRVVLAQDFNGHRTLQHGITGAINNGHAAFSQLFKDKIAVIEQAGFFHRMPAGIITRHFCGPFHRHATFLHQP